MKKILLSISALALAFSVSAQTATNAELSGNQPTTNGIGYKYNFNTSETLDNAVLNCTNGGTIWGTFGSPALSNFTIDAAGYLNIAFPASTETGNARYSSNRFSNGNCDNITSSPLNLSANKTISAKVKSSVDVDFFILASSLEGGQWISHDGSFTAVSLVGGEEFTTVNFTIADKNWQNAGDLSAVIGWEIWFSGPRDAGTLTFDEIAFGDAQLVNSQVIKNNNFSVYPNPASDVLTVEVDAVAASSVELVDLSGKLVATQSVGAGFNKVQFNVANVNAGLYFLSVRSANGVVTKKVIVK